MAVRKTTKKNVTKKITAQKRNDGYSNIVTGLGTSRDKTKATFAQASRLSWGEIDEMFEADPMARRVCNIFPYYALRKNPTYISDDDSVVELLKAEQKRLGVIDKLREAWLWARAFGGCAIVLGAEGDTEEPLAENVEIKFLRVVDRTQVNPVGEMDRDWESDNYGEPLFYNVSPIGGEPMIFHHSRIIKVQGDELSRRRYVGNQYWGESVLSSLSNSLTKYATVQDAIANLVVDYRQTVYKYENLEDIIAEGGEEDMKKRVELMDSVRSILNAMILGGEESIEIIGGGQTSGLPELVDKAIMRLCAETGVPHTVLLGDSPSGLGATGESERLDYNELVEALRDVKVMPGMDRIYNQCLRANGKKEYSYETVWPSLWTASPKDELDARAQQAVIDQAYANMGLPEPVILKGRFGGENGWSYETPVPSEVFEELEDIKEEEDDDFTKMKYDRKTYFKNAAKK